jgi:HSP20 family molecular chaperone IbpA
MRVQDAHLIAAKLRHATTLRRQNDALARTAQNLFQLADRVVVKGASLEHGLLHVDLVRELPEAMKPRTIPIATKGAGIK